MIGALGWTIVVPTLIGIFAGRWLDRQFGSPVCSGHSACSSPALRLGCTLAWKRMYRE